MIHELLIGRTRRLARINLEYVDWGSQSIVQSKFQRTAPFLGERCSREHSRFAPSILFRKNSEKYLGKNGKPCRLSISPLAFAASCLIEGIAENAKYVFLIKTFLIVLSSGYAKHCLRIVNSFIFLMCFPKTARRIFGNRMKLGRDLTYHNC